MNSVSGMGLIAGLLTTMAFVPQVLKVWRTRSAEDLSTGMFIVFSSGIVLWLIYGILRRDVPIIASNAGTLLLVITILVLKSKFHAETSNHLSHD